MITAQERVHGFRYREAIAEGFVLEVDAFHHQMRRLPRPSEIMRFMGRGRAAEMVEEVEITWHVSLNGIRVGLLRPTPNGRGVRWGHQLFQGKSVVEAAQVVARREIARRVEARNGGKL